MTTVLIPLAEGCEELEAVTLIDLLRRAEITVVSASLGEKQLTASRGVRLIADQQLDEVINQHFDMLILPGGMPGAAHLDADPRIHKLIKKMRSDSQAIAAICAAPKVLANAGILNGRRATCYPGTLTSNDWPEITLTDEDVVIDNGVLTSKGPGTAMDFALSIIEYLKGKDIRQQVEAGLVRSVG